MKIDHRQSLAVLADANAIATEHVDHMHDRNGWTYRAIVRALYREDVWPTRGEAIRIYASAWLAMQIDAPERLAA